MHDCNPITRDHEKQDGCGTAWRAFVHVKSRDDVDTITCNFDHGLSIIRRGTNKNRIDSKLAEMDKLAYDDLEMNRKKWLDPQPLKKIYEFIDSACS